MNSKGFKTHFEKRETYWGMGCIPGVFWVHCPGSDVRDIFLVEWVPYLPDLP